MYNHYLDTLIQGELLPWMVQLDRYVFFLLYEELRAGPCPPSNQP